MNFLIDFDDTIINSGEAHKCAYNLTFEYLNLEATSFSYSKFSGRSTREVLSEFIWDGGVLENAILYKQKCYKSFIEEGQVFLKDGFLDFQNYLSKTGLEWGIVSGGSKFSITRICDLLGIEPSLGIISAENYLKSKPYPDPYLKALNDWGLKAHECIAIEDSLNGIESAISANIQCLAINREINLSKCRVFSDWKSLHAYIELYLDN